VVFQAVHPRWSYVKVDRNGHLVEAAEKRPISDLATAGTYWFRRAELFFSAAMDMIRKDAHVEGHFYVCPAYNELVLRGAQIGVYRIAREEYFSLATPQGARSYEDHLVETRT
jgi:dTDP-glucose pyrophosphorylase